MDSEFSRRQIFTPDSGCHAPTGVGVPEDHRALALRLAFRRGRTQPREFAGEGPHPPVTDQLAQRFAREIRLTASLLHPNVVPPFTAGEADSLRIGASKSAQLLVGSEAAVLHDRPARKLRRAS